MFVQQVIGRVVVICADMELASKMGDNVNEFLKGCHHSSLASSHCFLLDAGDGMYVPCGKCCFFVGLAAGEAGQDIAKKRKSCKVPEEERVEYAAFVVRLAFDAPLDNQLGEVTKKFVVSEYVSSLTGIPASIRNHEQVSQWKTTLEAVRAEAHELVGVSAAAPSQAS